VLFSGREWRDLEQDLNKAGRAICRANHNKRQPGT
jgi:hypothetical protein